MLFHHQYKMPTKKEIDETLRAFAETLKEYFSTNERVWKEQYVNLELITRDQAFDLYFRKIAEGITDDEERLLKKYILLKNFDLSKPVEYISVYIFQTLRSLYIKKKFEYEDIHDVVKECEIKDQYEVIMELVKILGLEASDKGSYSTETVEQNLKRLKNLLTGASGIFYWIDEDIKSVQGLCKCINRHLHLWSDPTVKIKHTWKWSKNKKKHITHYTLSESVFYSIAGDHLLPLTIDLLFDVIPYVEELDPDPDDDGIIDIEKIMFNL